MVMTMMLVMMMVLMMVMMMTALPAATSHDDLGATLGKIPSSLDHCSG